MAYPGSVSESSRRSHAGRRVTPEEPHPNDIPALVATTRDGGLDISYVTTGTPRSLPIGLGLAFFRIAQEALTNVLKHAGPDVTTYVQFQWEDDAVALTVSDDGRGAAARGDGEGSGVEGMRERAEEVLSGIRTVHAGDAVITPSSTGRLLTRLAATLPDPTDGAGLEDLTDREREVLVLMARGLSNMEICDALFLAEPTVKTHVGKVLHKLGARDRVQAVVITYETGLVKPQG